MAGLNLAAITTAKYFIPHLLGHFLRDYPDVVPRLTITITNQSRVVECLENNLDDLMIMDSVPENMDLEARFFLNNPLVVVAPRAIPWWGKNAFPDTHRRRAFPPP